MSDTVEATTTRTRPDTDAPAAAERPPLRLVVAEHPRRLSRLTRLVSVLTIAAVLVVLFGLAAFHASLAQGQFELDRLQDRVSELTAQRAELELTVQELEAPERVASMAAELGLIAPERTTDLSTTVGPLRQVFDRYMAPGQSPVTP